MNWIDIRLERIYDRCPTLLLPPLLTIAFLGYVIAGVLTVAACCMAAVGIGYVLAQLI